MALRHSNLEALASADRIWHLRRTGLMEGLSGPDLKAVLSICRDCILSRGELLFDQGDPADALYILNRGCVRISLVSVDHRERIVGIYGSGILGESVLGPGEVFQVRATAHEESWVSGISRAQLADLARQRSAIALNFARLLHQRLVEARKDLEAHSFLDMEGRLCRALLNLAREHGRALFGKGDLIKLNIAVSHRQLAQMVGGNRPHVSLILSGFRKKGWIDYQGRRMVLRRSALEKKVAAGLAAL